MKSVDAPRHGHGKVRPIGMVAALLGAATVLASAAAPAAAAPATAAPATAARAGIVAPPGTISTVAGGVGGPARATKVSVAPCGVSFHAGDLYVADGPAVRKIRPDGSLTTPAGTGADTSFGPLGFGGPAARAGLGTCSVVPDRSGNLVIAEQSPFFRVAVVAAKTGTFYGQAMKAGDIYLVAGNGKAGASGSGVTATDAPLSGPAGVAVDHQGNLVLADTGIFTRHGFLKVAAELQVVAVKTGTFYGQAMKAGDIYTVAGFPKGRGVSGDGGPATKAQLGGTVFGVRVDSHGNLVFADAAAERVRVVAPSSGRFYGQAMKAGDIYTVAGDGKPGFSGDGGPATSAELQDPQDVAVDAAGNLVIADDANSRVRVVAASSGRFYGQAMKAGDIYTVAGDGTAGFSGDGGPATGAELNNPEGVAVNPATGNLVIADNHNSRVRVVAVKTGTFYGQAMTAGDIYTMAGNGLLYSGDGGPAARAEFRDPVGLALDGAGNMLISDFSDTVRLAAATSGTFFGRAMTAGDIYTVAGNGSFGFSGDGGPATSAQLGSPQGVRADGAGNLVIADQFNERIRVVAAASGRFYGRAMTAGDIYTVAGNGSFGFSGDGGPATQAELEDPGDVAVDAAGNLVIADDLNDRVRVVAATSGTFYGQAMTAGDIYTVAGNGSPGFSGDGGPATSAGVAPGTLAVDGAGNLVIADQFNERIRVVAVTSGTFYGQAMTAGDIYTVAGNGRIGFSGDGGPATSATLANPEGLAVDGAGNLVIADNLNHRVRVVAVTSGTFYGQAMTAGDIYTVAGNGKPGFSGDGGPATRAELPSPAALATGSAGDLLIADGDARRVRMVTG